MSCIVVVGCYRSGTSAIAGALARLGVHMGDNFDPPNSNNMSGYWEDLEFKNLHKKFEDDDNHSNITIEYLNLIQKREKKYKIWGVKDPLLCVNFIRLISNVTNGYKIIVCRRKLEDIALSMSKALNEKKYPLRFLPLAEHYVKTMNKQLNEYGGSFLEMDHDETIKNPSFHINRIANFIGVKSQKKAVDFIANYK